MKSQPHATPIQLAASGDPQHLDEELARGSNDLKYLEFGTVSLTFRTLVDGTLLALAAADGAAEWALAIEKGRLIRRFTTPEERSLLDAEDADHLADGGYHDLVLTVSEDGTRIYVDGYQAFSGTSTAFFAHVPNASALYAGQDGVPEIQQVSVREDVLSPRRVLAQSTEVDPLVQFAEARLAERDAARCSVLSSGSLRARFRVRGRHQGGVLLQGGPTNASTRGNWTTDRSPSNTVTLRVDEGSLQYTVTTPGRVLADLVAPGNWDDGGWHDVVVTSGYGATTIYADGYQVAHEPGVAFFADAGNVEAISAGMDLAGSRLFGEVQTGMIFDRVLSDAQVKRLAMVEPLDTTTLFDAGFLGSTSYRIPSLLTTESGVLIAGADQRTAIANDSPNHINFVVRRSLDDGDTWEEPILVIESPGQGATGASVIDSLLVQDRKLGRVIALIDHFPGGAGQPNVEAGTGFDEQGRLELHDAEGRPFRLEAGGTVHTAEGDPTPYIVGPDGTITANGTEAGNIWLPGGSPALQAKPTSYLWMVSSDDDGATWSEPVDITPQVKLPWMRFLGTSPGSGIQIQRGLHAGRLVMPVYHNREEGITFSAAVVYSDDAGTTWTIGNSPNDGREFNGTTLSSRDLDDDEASLHESTVFEGPDGRLCLMMRNQHRSGFVAKAYSTDGGESWSQVEFDPQVPEIFSQPDSLQVLTSSGPAVVFANASQMLPFRGCGVLRMSRDGGQTWEHNRVFNPRHYVYQSMAQLANGDLGLLWEREWHGLYFTRVPLSWLEASRNSLTKI